MYDRRSKILVHSQLTTPYKQQHISTILTMKLHVPLQEEDEDSKNQLAPDVENKTGLKYKRQCIYIWKTFTATTTSTAVVTSHNQCVLCSQKYITRTGRTSEGVGGLVENVQKKQRPPHRHTFGSTSSQCNTSRLRLPLIPHHTHPFPRSPHPTLHTRHPVTTHPDHNCVMSNR